MSNAVLVAFGVNGDGQREVLGVSVTQGEMERCWLGFWGAWWSGACAGCSWW